LHWRLPNSARNLAEAEFGRIWEKWPNFEFAEAEAEIRCNPSCGLLNAKFQNMFIVKTSALNRHI